MFDPEQFLNLAQRLAFGDEAEIRTAISRAYYAAFLVARYKLNIRYKNPDVHKVVIEEVYRRGLKNAAHNLHILRRLRNLADYDVNDTIINAQAKEAIQLSQIIIRVILSPNQ